MINAELENQMKFIIEENNILRNDVEIGRLAEEQLKKNEKKLQELTRVYNNDVAEIRIEVRQLKHFILDNEMEEIPGLINRIENLLGGVHNG